MPIHEYQCKACGARFEEITHTSKTPAPACPVCSSKDVVRLLSAPSAQAPGKGAFPPGGGCGSGGFS